MEKIIVSLLTTEDNPFDPFDDFENWYIYDQDHHHFCCEKLAEKVGDLNDSNEVEKIKITESAIDYIVTNDMLHKYKKVQKVCEID